MSNFSYEKTQFLSKENLNMLWDVLYNSNYIQKNKNNLEMKNIVQFFNNQLREFYEIEQTTNTKTSLIELNKAFVQHLTTSINTIQNSHMNSQIIYNRNNTEFNKQYIQPIIKQTQEQENKQVDFITKEQRQEFEQKLFQQKLQSKQQEFVNYMEKPIPSTPNFSDPQTSNYDFQNINEKMEQTLKERKEQNAYFTNLYNTQQSQMQQSQMQQSQMQQSQMQQSQMQQSQMQQSQMQQPQMQNENKILIHIQEEEIPQENIKHFITELPSFVENNKPKITWKEPVDDNEITFLKEKIVGLELKIVTLERKINDLE